MEQRKLEHIYRPQGKPGFLGSGHIARALIQRDFADSDPFILLMDDMLDKKDTTPAGGPHPHAGFETVTLMLEGEMGVGAHKMGTGDMQMMTAGRGVVHTEVIDKPARIRILQLWLTLAQKDRWTQPRVQDIAAAHVPQREENGMNVKVYSGSFAGLTSPMQNHVPVIIADVALAPGATTVQQLPANYTTFMYVIQGSITAGADKQHLQQDEVGWLNRLPEENPSELTLTAGQMGARLILYAGQPTGDAIVPYGPFIADSTQDISRLYHEYHIGKMEHINEVGEEWKRVW